MSSGIHLGVNRYYLMSTLHAKGDGIMYWNIRFLLSGPSVNAERPEETTGLYLLYCSIGQCFFLFVGLVSYGFNEISNYTKQGSSPTFKDKQTPYWDIYILNIYIVYIL